MRIVTLGNLTPNILVRAMVPCEAKTINGNVFRLDSGLLGTAYVFLGETNNRRFMLFREGETGKIFKVKIDHAPKFAPVLYDSVKTVKILDDSTKVSLAQLSGDPHKYYYHWLTGKLGNKAPETQPEN